MTKIKDKKAIATLAAGIALAAASLGCYALYQNEAQENDELKQQLERLAKNEKQSVVMQRVNAQMEEIANAERRISDEQREAALEQSRLAEQERQNAEDQRRQAEQERQNALVAEKKAVEASQVAQHQRQIAEQQRTEAEYSKRRTDTLSYLTMARSLSNTAITQYMAGNRDIADMLAYTAILYTYRYHGDINSDMTYQALAMTSQNKNVWNKHKGSVTDIEFIGNKGNDLVTCSTYGEVLRHQRDGSNLRTETLVRNAKYDFRDLYYDKSHNTIYVLSRTSHLLVIRNNIVEKDIELNLHKPIKIEYTGGQLYLFSDHTMALFDMNSNQITHQKALPNKLTCISRLNNAPILFDNKGNQYLVRSFDNIETSRVPFNGIVTAFAESKHERIKVYGMSDGTLYYVNAKGKATQLTGHRSQISKIKINGYRIYTSSYDGTLNLWLTNMSKIEPMTLCTGNSWIMTFTYDPQKANIWTGDQRGNLTEALINLSTMINRLKNRLKRNLTRDEWKYFIGSNVPYEEILGKEVQL